MRKIAIIAAGLLLAGASHAADSLHVRDAEAFVKAALPDTCDMNDRNDIPVNSTDPEDVSHYVYTVSYRYSFDAPTDPAHQTTLYQMFCTMGAYNISSVFLLRDNESQTFTLLSFARPTVTYVYTDENDTAIKAPPVVSGYAADLTLVNAAYDPKTGVISNRSLWRGLGDAWSGGQWKMVDGEFVLSRYEVDPTYDLNADNPPADPEAGYVVVGH